MNRGIEHPDLQPVFSLLRNTGDNATDGIPTNQQRILVKPQLIRQRKPSEPRETTEVSNERLKEVSQTRNSQPYPSQPNDENQYDGDRQQGTYHRDDQESRYGFCSRLTPTS